MCVCVYNATFSRNSPKLEKIACEYSVQDHCMHEAETIHFETVDSFAVKMWSHTQAYIIWVTTVNGFILQLLREEANRGGISVPDKYQANGAII